MGSAAEAEVGGLYMNALELSPMRTTLEELDLPQLPTLLKTDNSTADGIMNKTIKQRQSKAVDKRFYWLQDRVEQGEFRVFCAPGENNLADYFTKYYSPATHRQLRPIYTYVEGQSPTSLQGCIEILTSIDKPRQITTDKTSMQGTQATNSNRRASQSPSYHLLDKLTKALLFSNLGFAKAVSFTRNNTLKPPVNTRFHLGEASSPPLHYNSA